MGRPENSITIDGRMGKDAEVKTFNSGAKVAKFSICQNSSKKNPVTQAYDIACWYDVAFWIKTDADENTVRQLVKGAKIKVIGKLDMDHWTNSEGKKISKIFISAQDIRFNERIQSSAPSYSEPSRGREQEQFESDIPF